MRRKLVAGNWKMNGTGADLKEIDALGIAWAAPRVEIVVCPPATLVSRVAFTLGGQPIRVGGQDCHAEQSGAHTGDVAAEMLAEAGATHVILGHSERRADHGETDAIVHAKVEAAHRAKLTAIVCVGESLEQREGGTTLDVVAGQLAASLPDGATAQNTVVAYEPIWAIGTGKVPSTEQIAEVHGAIRDKLRERFGEEADGIRLLYGGSVKADNAEAIFATADVDGALVGGASLKSTDFSPIVSALESSL
ncbi:triose-phosphate isomerase [Limimaricola pyoseonensis]|uniref:Triosephosphate isomerase n=1 Tax=Limimaricola pyoseonensis TaxID=521013 RepID=A0A1G7H2X0_9RHOB|nr:triose-phosphate isomerase [Limimaricola pyoseonensis]SDE94499.1 triosephosphate isomerase [Limimaricola pyoseonensis]